MKGATADGMAICATLREEIRRLGWSKTARLTGVDRCSLHRAFPPNPGNRTPNFTTFCLVARALGFGFRLEDMTGARAAPNSTEATQ